MSIFSILKKKCKRKQVVNKLNLSKMKRSPQQIETSSSSPQCQYFVVRKKRLCRMTVKPGKQYCGEHEPQPKTDDGKDDTRIPCPNDPKHTCYASKLEKHLSICNARLQEQPDYIIPNINVSEDTDDSPRLPLNKIPLKKILEVIEKVNALYDKYLDGKITAIPEKPIHATVENDFNESGRAESSLRHLRQASRLLHIIEDEQLAKPNTCFVELGAGKGHLSYYAWWAWCQDNKSNVLLVDRASLRHKRDNKLRDNLKTNNDSKDTENNGSSTVCRIRADLAHLALERVPAVQATEAVVGFAKHLCGVATDYALRCATSPRVLGRVAGAALATCCHHRCVRATCLATPPLQKLGINGDDFNVLLGIVSWATCGDGRSRELRAKENQDKTHTHEDSLKQNNATEDFGTKNLNLSQERREKIGKRAKLLIDWGRVLYLRECGFDARLVYYVPSSVSLENVCIVAKKSANSQVLK